MNSRIAEDFIDFASWARYRRERIVVRVLLGVAIVTVIGLGWSGLKTAGIISQEETTTTTTTTMQAPATSPAMARTQTTSTPATATTTPTTPFASEGDQDFIICAIQAALIDKGHTLAHGVDCTWGADTTRAMSSYYIDADINENSRTISAASARTLLGL